MYVVPPSGSSAPIVYNSKAIPSGSDTPGNNKYHFVQGPYLPDNDDYWTYQPAKKDIFDKIYAWITGDNSEKTQLQQVIDAQFITKSIEEQSFANYIVNAVYTEGRALGSVDRLNQILDGEHPAAITKGVSNSYLSPEMEQKILEGERIPGKNGVR